MAVKKIVLQTVHTSVS